MDSQLLLAKCITLLYRESEISQNNHSIDLCQKIIDTIKLPETSVEVQSGREVIVGLRATLQWMFNQCKEGKCDKTQLLQRVRINTKDDTYLYNAVVDGIEPLETEGEIKAQVINYRQGLKEYLDGETVKSIISKAFQKANFGDGSQNYLELIREIHTELEPYTHGVVDKRHPSIVDSVSFDEPEEVKNLLRRSKDETSSDGVLRLGWQGINRMLGKSGGLRRGETVVIGALQHNFKTGFTMNWFKHLALYNKPYMRDPTKKPLLIHASLENELPMNIMWLYANLKENETGEPCDVTMVDIEEATKYIQEKMKVNGYHIEMFRIEPGQCNYMDFQDMILKYESDGYEIHAIVVDYLSMMNKQGLDRAGPTGTEVRELYRRMRNFCAPRGITFITPHQLSTEAKALVRQGVESFVQEIANKGYYEGSRQIDQEVDLEIYIHIEKVRGKGSFLTVQRGKHRKIDITPNQDLYTVLPFSDVGGIKDDINGADTSLRSVGGTPMGEDGDGGQEWFDI